MLCMPVLDYTDMRSLKLKSVSDFDKIRKMLWFLSLKRKFANVALNFHSTSIPEMYFYLFDQNITSTLSQFHQHYMRGFCANIFAPKNTNLKSKYKKVLRETFPTKKPRVKCWWNRPLVFFSNFSGKLSFFRTLLPPLEKANS